MAESVGGAGGAGGGGSRRETPEEARARVAAEEVVGAEEGRGAEEVVGAGTLGDAVDPDKPKPPDGSIAGDPVLWRELGFAVARVCAAASGGVPGGQADAYGALIWDTLLGGPVAPPAPAVQPLAAAWTETGAEPRAQPPDLSALRAGDVEAFVLGWEESRHAVLRGLQGVATP